MLNAIQAGEQDDEAFSFIYDFFRKDTFPPADDACDASDGAPYFLYRAVGSSQLVTDYASEQLPKEGFRGLIDLCQFFLDNVDKKFQKPDLILEQSVPVLLRMVFILMAEDKRLLPIGNPKYGRMSLMALAYDLCDPDISPKPSGTEQ